MQHIPTNNIKIAAALTAIGYKLRQPDPVTCIQSIKDSKPFNQYVFWFDANPADIRPVLNAAYDFLKDWKFTLPVTDPLYSALAALYNRETLLAWMRASTPFHQIMKDNSTILMPVNASEYLKNEMRKHI